jgi:hypothetical protein
MEIKATQIAALMTSRDLFREDPERGERVREVSARWMLVLKALGAG